MPQSTFPLYTALLIRTIMNFFSTTFPNQLKPAIKKADASNPLKGVDYIDLPQKVRAKRAVINVKNKDNRCFEYAILSALHHNEIKIDHQRPSKYKEYVGKLNVTDIEFPVSLKDIAKFEKQNP